MVHFTCDVCGKAISAVEDLRYVVKIEVYAASDPLELTEADLEKDHMEQISQLIKHIEETKPEDFEDQVYKSFRFDLCPACQKKYLKDPLSRDARRHLKFSEN